MPHAIAFVMLGSALAQLNEVIAFVGFMGESAIAFVM
ncbi:hypothetical protein Cal7507_4862 [Calothrix sp. PCC 7507]|nr:hypothetical protein Cal7507_4862 [Calothrix sp. PCC 7507]